MYMHMYMVYMFVIDSLFTDLHIFRVLGKMFRVPWQIGKLVHRMSKPKSGLWGRGSDRTLIASTL